MLPCPRRWAPRALPLARQPLLRVKRPFRRPCFRATAPQRLEVSSELDPYLDQVSDTPDVLEFKQNCRQARDEAEARYEERRAEMLKALSELEPGQGAGGAAGWVAGKSKAMFEASLDFSARTHAKRMELMRREHAEELAARYTLQDPAVAAVVAEAQMAAMVQAAEQMGEPGPQTAVTIGSALLSAATITALGGLFGLPANQQLVLPPGVSYGTLGVEWLEWTVPYALATVAYYLLVRTGDEHRVLRSGMRLSVLRRLSPANMLALAVGVSMAQCVVYQGMWQVAVFQYLGAPTATWGVSTYKELLQPAVETATGALVNPRALPFLVVAPLGALFVGAAEAAVSTCFRRILSSSKPVVIFDSTGDITQMGFIEETLIGEMDPGVLPSSAKEDEDLWLTAARVGLSGAWLSAETALTGSLWLAIATSSAGLLTAMLVVRSQEPNDTPKLDSGGGSSS